MRVWRRSPPKLCHQILTPFSDGKAFQWSLSLSHFLYLLYHKILDLSRVFFEIFYFFSCGLGVVSFPFLYIIYHRTRTIAIWNIAQNLVYITPSFCAFCRRARVENFTTVKRWSVFIFYKVPLRIWSSLQHNSRWRSMRKGCGHRKKGNTNPLRKGYNRRQHDTSEFPEHGKVQSLSFFTLLFQFFHTEIWNNFLLL